ncbi:MAG: recombinase family protein [Firmicutes bacterium]|nr:recombinase family protein [Bacillota bacterium]
MKQTGCTVAYIRVLSEGQNTARQRKALKAAGCTVFYEEEISDSTMERPQLKRLLKERKRQIIPTYQSR